MYAMKVLLTKKHFKIYLLAVEGYEDFREIGFIRWGDFVILPF